VIREEFGKTYEGYNLEEFSAKNTLIFQQVMPESGNFFYTLIYIEIIKNNSCHNVVILG